MKRGCWQQNKLNIADMMRLPPFSSRVTDNKTSWISSTGKVLDIQPVLLSGFPKELAPRPLSDFGTKYPKLVDTLTKRQTAFSQFLFFSLVWFWIFQQVGLLWNPFEPFSSSLDSLLKFSRNSFVLRKSADPWTVANDRKWLFLICGHWLCAVSVYLSFEDNCRLYHC